MNLLRKLPLNSINAFKFIRMSQTITIHNNIVPVTAEPNIDIQAVIGNQNFEKWYTGLDENLLVKDIHIQSVDRFGNGKIGFIKFKSTIYRKDIPNSRSIPGIIFMRGPSVAILIVLKCNNQCYTILTRQARTAIGSSNFPEIPAGTFDGDHFKGVASNELKEEVGLSIEEKDLVDLTKTAYKDNFKGMYPSPGACDEFIKLYLYEKEISEEELKQYEGKATGVSTSGEYITLQVCKLDDVWRITPDSKTLCSIFLYNQLKMNNEI